MTNEQRKAYRREWDKRNRDKKKQYQLNKAIREVIADIESGRIKADGKVITA